MNVVIATRPAAQAPAGTYLPGERVDPGWVQRRDDAVGLVCAVTALGIGCGLVITGLGCPVGPLLAGALSVVCAGWFWRWGGGGSA